MSIVHAPVVRECWEVGNSSLELCWRQISREETRQEESGGEGGERGSLRVFSFSLLLKSESDSNLNLIAVLFYLCQCLMKACSQKY